VTKRMISALSAAAILTASLVLATGAGATAGSGKSDSGVAYFSITHAVGSTSYAAGQGHDKVLGNVAATYQIGISSSSGTVTVNVKKLTVYTGTGSLTGTATATVTITGTTETITGGKLTLTKGFGSQAGHSLKATFSGTANTTKNQYSFHYKGTYK
jgi:hypothetical protein